MRNRHSRAEKNRSSFQQITYFFKTVLTLVLATMLNRFVLALVVFGELKKRLWEIDGVISTSVGYAGGFTENPTYEEVCSGQTGHTEVVLVTFDILSIKLGEILKVFWEMHDPTQGFRQGNDVGTQYRSAIYYCRKEQESVLISSMESYERILAKAGLGDVTTEIKKLERFYFAEDYHQQYLIKNPNGYCALRGTGCKFDDE